MTSKTVVLRMFGGTESARTRGVYPVMRKWHLGVGISEAKRPEKSLFMYPGYRRVVVLAAIMVATRLLR